MTLLQLQYFDTVCQAGTVSGAAAMLHIAQPSLSVALKNLEEELGLELFARRGRGLELTAAGSRLLPYARKVLADAERFRLEAAWQKEQDKNRLRLSYVDVVEDQVPGWIRKIQQKEGQRQLLVDTQSASTGEILRDLKEGRCDLGIVSEKEEEGELHFQLLEEMEYMAAVYERHPLASKESIFLEEISRDPFVAYEKSSMAGKLLDPLLAALGFSPRIRYRASTEDAILAFVREGFGVSVLACRPCRVPSGIRMLKLPQITAKRRFYLAVAKGSRFRETHSESILRALTDLEG